MAPGADPSYPSEHAAIAGAAPRLDLPGRRRATRCYGRPPVVLRQVALYAVTTSSGPTTVIRRPAPRRS
ncbi:MAG: hypothetical protein ACRDY5_06875, partial [Acidimicrobiales bacterium]